MDLLQRFPCPESRYPITDQRPLIGQNFSAVLEPETTSPVASLTVYYNARAQLHNEVIVNLVLIVADDAAAQHRNTLHVIGLAVALERIQLTLKLAVQRVRHQRAHGLPLLVLPAVLHLDISIGYLFQEFLRREVRSFSSAPWVDRAFIRRYSARRSSAAGRTAAALFVLTVQAGNNNDDDDHNEAHTAANSANISIS